MGKRHDRKLRDYFRIYEQILNNPTANIREITKNTGLCRNTVSKYLEKMHEQNIMKGPFLSMRSFPNYKEYVHFMNFEDPTAVFEGLKTFPHVLYHAMASGNWDTLVVTDRPLDLTKLVGFQTMIYQGVKQTVYTPRTNYTTWEEGFKKSSGIIDECTPAVGYKNRKSAPRLPWKSDEWKLFHAFGNNVRKPVTPTLREIGVRYETYQKWVRNLERYCTIHAEFYPKGYLKYTHYHVLFTSDHEEVIQSVFSWLPVTPVFTEIGNHLLVSVPVTASERIRALMCHLYDMKAKRMVERFDDAMVLREYIHFDPTGDVNG
jgi:hypothetical protein